MESVPPIPSQSHGRTFAVALAVLGAGAIALGVAGLWNKKQAPVPAAENPPDDGPAFDTLVLGAAAVPEETPLPSVVPQELPRPTPVPAGDRAGTVSAMLADQIAQAKALRDRGDTANALLRFREALAMAPDNIEAIAEVAITYERLGQVERAMEYWRRVYERGEGAGIYYAAAEAKLAPASAPPGAAAGRAPASPDAPGIEPGKSLGILEVVADDRSTPGEKRMILKIPVKKRPGASVDVGDVVIQVFFYDLTPDASVVQTDASVSSRWTTVPADWSDDDIEILEVEYVRVPGEGGETRDYYGYIARVYYRRELQAWRADPPKLRAQYPPPLILPTDPDL